MPMLRLEIHDVGHGACSMVTLPDGTRIMIDCGCDPKRPWWPSVHYCGQFIDTLVIQNLDEDHVQDLPDLWKNVPLGSIFTNPTVGSQALDFMKQKGGMNNGVTFAHGLLQAFNPGAIGQLPLSKGGGASVWIMWNQFGADVHDTNNLSVVTFVQYGDFMALFAGDLEVKGWEALLTNPLFQATLPRVSVLIASHHGRENGCSTEAFSLMRPEIVVFSDDEIQFETQKMASWYRARVKGIPDLTRPRPFGDGFEQRKVLTTRRDGTIMVDVRPDGKYLATGTKISLPPPTNALRRLNTIEPSLPPFGLNYLGHRL